MKSLWRLHGIRRLNAKVGVDSRGSVDLGSVDSLTGGTGSATGGGLGSATGGGLGSATGGSRDHWSRVCFHSRSCSINWRLCWWWCGWWNHSLNCQFIGIYNFTHFSFRSSLEGAKGSRRASVLVFGVLLL